MNQSRTHERHIQIVAVCYRLAPAVFIARLEAITRKSDIRIRGVAVSNNPDHPLDSVSSDIEVIRGSNLHLDFSGYFEGMAWLLSNRPHAALANILFVNDSLVTKHAAKIILHAVLQHDGLLREISVPALAGKMDPYRSICLRNPWSNDVGYITTFCFLLNSHALSVMGQLLEYAGRDGVLSPLPISEVGWGIGLDLKLRELIRAHISYRDSPYLWAAAAAQAEELKNKKARCVYFESRLSGAIGAAGVIIPINSGPRSALKIVFGEMLSRLWRMLMGTHR